ncbi:MAG: LPS export ABC transporter periplasmic protein LptC [Psychrobium sp.]|nr:LPS export ABC transporter periplasmic protein LptC [Psychrobium sp.]
MSRSIVFICLFFISCILLFWNPFWSVTTPPKKQESGLYLPDFTAKDMTLRQFDQAGYLSSLVHAQEMEHYDNGLTKFTKPSYIIYPKQGAPRWKIDADYGTFDQRYHVQLTDNVVIKAINPEEKVQLVTMASLSINLQTMMITSDSAIEISGHRFNIQGTGLRASFNLQQFELIKNTKAVYENLQR